jgi:hypothetical protein
MWKLIAGVKISVDGKMEGPEGYAVVDELRLIAYPLIAG